MKKWNIGAVALLLVLFGVLIRSQAGDHRSFPPTTEIMGMSYQDLIDTVGQPSEVASQASMAFPDSKPLNVKTLVFYRGPNQLTVNVTDGFVTFAAIAPKS